MADRFIINVKPYQGEYPLDLEEPFSTLEWRWIKQISGYLPLTLRGGMAGRDPDLILAWAVIAMYRAGRIEASEALRVADNLAVAPLDGATIQFVPDEEEEADEGPPVEASATAAELPRPNGGEPLSPASDPPDNDPSRTGLLPSETSAASDLVTSRP